MSGFPPDAHAYVLSPVKTLSGTLVDLRGLAGIVDNPLMTRSFLSSRWRPVRKTLEHLDGT